MREKEEFKGCKHRDYGMNGLRKQTNSIHYSIKRCVIKRMDDWKGIGKGLIRTHHAEELQHKIKEESQFFGQPR